MLAMINRIVLETSRATNLVDALSLIVSHILETLSADACSIFLCDDESGEYVLLATHGLNADLIGKARVKFGEGLVGLVGEREEAINLSNAPEHPQFHSFSKLELNDYQGFLGVPIIFRANLLGVLVVQQKEARVFAEDERLRSDLSSARRQNLILVFE